MEKSLRPIRTSAKKKAEKIFRESFSRSPSPPGHDSLSESGIFSQGSGPKTVDGGKRGLVSDRCL